MYGLGPIKTIKKIIKKTRRNAPHPFGRYIAVCRPYEALLMCTVSKARKQTIVVLVLATLFNVPKFAERTVVIKSDCLCLLRTALGENKVA